MMIMCWGWMFELLTPVKSVKGTLSPLICLKVGLQQLC